MATPIEEDPQRLGRIRAKAQETADACGELKEHHAAKAVEFGYAQQVFEGLVKGLDNIGNMPDGPELASAEDAVVRYGQYVEKSQEAEIKIISSDPDASWMASDATTAVSTSVNWIMVESVHSTIAPLRLPEPPPTWNPRETATYAHRLSALDPELGRLLLAVWDSYYGLKNDNGRAALVLMRQLLDHFFGKLAPDDEVRKSPYFSSQGKKRPDEVHRRERIKYAARSHVSDAGLADALVAETDSMLSAYERLNMLHTRGALDKEEVRKALTIAEHKIRQWIDALGLR